jgi:hypothetical protein
MSEEQPLTFQLLFTIPRMASAYARHPDGGARMKIDIEESTVAAANQMLDLMVKRPRAIFAAAIVVILEPEEAQQDAPKEDKVISWKERAANRR